MYAIHGKSWSSVVSSLETHPVFLRIENLLRSPRFWAGVSLVFVFALILVAIAALAMLALWASTIDLSTYSPTQIIN